jgi:1,4-dihydroxy-2-naphthoate octaprenyltransferase
MAEHQSIEFLKGIILMSRPLVLLSTLLSWFLGVSIAIGSGAYFVPQKFLFGLIVILFSAASIHYVNEYADYETDTFTRRTFFSGGSGILPRGKVPREQALILGQLSLIIALLLQIFALLNGIHPPAVLFVTIIGISGGWMYSLPPLKLAWRGLGELDNAFLGACLLPFHGYLVIAGNVDWWVFLAILPISLIAFNHLLIVTWPDRKADAKVGKKTLATLLNPAKLRAIFLAVSALSFLIHLIIWGRVIPTNVFLAGLFAFPFIFYGFFTYTKSERSLSVLFALHFMIIAQSVAWLSL